MASYSIRSASVAKEEELKALMVSIVDKFNQKYNGLAKAEIEFEIHLLPFERVEDDRVEKAFAQGADPTTRRMLGHILNWLQERRANSFFVATANDVTELPSELIRKGRFDELFFVDLPDEKARADIFAIHLRKRHRDPRRFNCEKLAAEARHFSGAEIEQAVIAALFTAFSRGSELKQDDILDAIQDIVPLYKQREDDIKRLREWATERTRQATNNAKLLSYFSKMS
jgi:SpoVK/Ycf46/Vps4 family AAA+-type ATPase